MTISPHCFKAHCWRNKRQETFIRNEGRKRLKKNVFFLLTTTFFPTCGSAFQRYQAFHQLAGLHIGRARCETCTLCNKQHPLQAWSVWVSPEIYQIGRWKIKHPATFLGHGPLSLEHWPLWLAGVRWPCPIPPSARHSSQCKQKTGALIRDAWWWQFISWPSCLMKPLCHAHWVGALATGRRQYRWSKANKDVLCALLFLCDVFFNFLRGGRRLPYLRLFIPANRLVAFCLQVTQPEVTFNSWTKKMSGHALWRSL